MGYYKRVTLTCDCEGCEGCSDNGRGGCLSMFEHDTGKATDAREYAKRAGWTYRNGNDYCEGCK